MFKKGATLVINDLILFVSFQGHPECLFITACEAYDVQDFATALAMFSKASDGVLSNLRIFFYFFLKSGSLRCTLQPRINVSKRRRITGCGFRKGVGVPEALCPLTS